MKSSFGTAFKMFSNRWFPNILTYGLLLGIASVAYHDPLWMEKLGVPQHVHSPEQVISHDATPNTPQPLQPAEVPRETKNPFQTGPPPPLFR